jgi:type IV pilus assembly protein PilY1
MATFSTNRPIPAAAGTCATTLGEARGYLVNLLNGSGAIGVAGSCGGYRSGIFVGGGLPPSPVLGTIPVGGVPKTVVIGAIQKSGASSSPIGAQQVRPPISSTRKRIYWYMPGLDN